MFRGCGGKPKPGENQLESLGFTYKGGVGKHRWRDVRVQEEEAVDADAAVLGEDAGEDAANAGYRR